MSGPYSAQVVLRDPLVDCAVLETARGGILVAIAENDDQKEPQAKDELRSAFKAAGRPAEVEVYAGAQHGWCVPGSAGYNPEGAEKAWSALLALYRRRLT